MAHSPSFSSIFECGCNILGLRLCGDLVYFALFVVTFFKRTNLHKAYEIATRFFKFIYYVLTSHHSNYSHSFKALVVISTCLRHCFSSVCTDLNFMDSLIAVMRKEGITVPITCIIKFA